MNKTKVIFGDWRIIDGPFINKAAQKTEWLCQCKCGVQRRVRMGNLKSGISTNCGCRRREILTRRNRLTTGGIWVENPKTAHTWDRMIRRCYDPKSKGFRNYGGRGITVCDRWKGVDGLKHFIADMGTPFAAHSLGRINNDGGYSPENCRWETNEEQQSNKRTNVYGFIGTERMTAAQIGRRLGRHSSAVAKDIRKGNYANNCDLS